MKAHENKPRKTKSDESNSLAPANWPDLAQTDLEQKIRERTPARLLLGRAGAGYRTGTQLDLREAHAAARDAVRTELALEKQFSADFVKRWGLFEVSTAASSKDEYLLRPDLGRIFPDASRSELLRRVTPQTDLQILVGDGLSVTAVFTQVPKVLPRLCEQAQSCGWTLGQTFVVRHCRVAILNQIGELLQPKVVVLLIGERPGLATAESLSAYMAYRPQTNHTDADRNLISNIHSRGVSPSDAADHIIRLAQLMMNAKISGTQLQGETPKGFK